MKKNKGFTLLEVLVALIVLGAISIIYLKYEVQSVKRQEMIRLASFLEGIDKAFYSADALVSYPVMPVTQCGGNACLFAGTQNGQINYGFINNLIDTSIWINQVQGAPSPFPENFLDPTINFPYFLNKYNFIIYAFPTQNNQNNYNISEIEVKPTNNNPFTQAELVLLYDYLGNRICVDSNGNLHYFLDNTLLSNVSASNFNCPSGGVNANYYTVTAQK